MDAIRLAVDLLDSLPANRTLGVTVIHAVDGEGRAQMSVDDKTQNVIGALHSSGIVALADAAGLAAVLSTAPDQLVARRLQPLGTRARMEFRRPVQRVGSAVCRLAPDAWDALTRLYAGVDYRVALSTEAVIHGDDEPEAARGSFDWVVRLTP